MTRQRTGRRNHYAINRENEMRHQAQFGFEIGPLLDLLRRETADDPAEPGQATA